MEDIIHHIQPNFPHINLEYEIRRLFIINDSLTLKKQSMIGIVKEFNMLNPICKFTSNLCSVMIISELLCSLGYVTVTYITETYDTTIYVYNILQLKTSIYTPNYMHKEPITTLSEKNRYILEFNQSYLIHSNKFQLFEYNDKIISENEEINYLKMIR